ncbi:MULTISPECIES: FecCD family ABC transporter permease [Pasteurella]|uniref:FecCD family ABC transporter permease n=1 Tax=Pasteurella TaxID=745 RepID=UPI0002145B16|nr:MULTISPECIES: iron ABC transporter permease [Pasteurella]EGP04210.1 HemU [Pasteurella multocida subsp. multocida str. Anand1_goat]AMM82697.1 peptide ABC transporter substrate-binding protein [Pasteurella multocida subsp. multocida PMTB2.1]APW57373.1 peptide ABC transporter substrate-binding protein [Pasteurella multocida]AXQ73038.1 peptide ABC transporter substrate-binding protein [Pasteurella multocida subsp. multocida]MCH4804782.1 iron ABC transporter permease [Pasteurella multocida]
MNVTARLWLPPILLVLVAISACLIGQYHIAFHDVWQAVLHIAADNPRTDAETVLWNIRLPRIFTAIIVGAALSVAGATYQGMFKNPLVSPDILGVTAGAGLGAVTAIYFGGSLFTIQVVAFLGGLLAVFLVYLISRTAPHHSPTLALVLAGIAIASLLSAGISLLKILSDPYSQLTTITFWLMGGLNMATLNDLALVAPLICASLIPLILLRWRMNLLSLDDEEAETLGINTKRTRLIFILSATLMTSAAVSITGIIGWVGLIIPHIARLWIGADFRRLLPTSLFIGATFLLLTDTIARSIFSIEVPLGIITSLVGAPFFLSLLIQGGKR